jgi:hypothetical protein
VSFRAGQTFLFPLNDNTRPAHLWIIATEPNPEGMFAVASFTSLRGAKDQTVVVRPAEHPFVKWDTCISYALAEVSNVDRLQEQLNCGRAKMHQDVSAPVLALILDGFTASDYTKKRVREFVKNYKAAARSRTA